MGDSNWNISQCVSELSLNKWNRTIEKSGTVSTIDNPTGAVLVPTLMFRHIRVSPSSVNGAC
jgi:hypothetical protein